MHVSAQVYVRMYVKDKARCCLISSTAICFETVPLSWKLALFFFFFFLPGWIVTELQDPLVLIIEKDFQYYCY